MLAYYLSIYELVIQFGNETIAPMIIDTPNQHEQAFVNYNKIVNLITTKVHDESQVIICAMENDQLKPFQENANVIYLDNRKILISDEYDELSNKFKAIK